MTTTDTTATTSRELVERWLRLWNGERDLAERLIAPEFRLHAAMVGDPTDTAVSGAAGLSAWIDGTRAAMPDLAFAIEVGPLVDGELVALRWTADGHYAGGFPGATAAPGTTIAFTGTDLLRVRDGRIAEYWVNSDMHVLFAQLDVRSA